MIKKKRKMCIHSGYYTTFWLLLVYHYYTLSSYIYWKHVSALLTFCSDELLNKHRQAFSQAIHKNREDFFLLLFWFGRENQKSSFLEYKRLSLCLKNYAASLKDRWRQEKKIRKISAKLCRADKVKFGNRKTK